MSSSKKAAQAINEMVQFGQSDQSELLKVIEDYFDDWDCTSPSEDEDEPSHDHDESLNFTDDYGLDMDGLDEMEEGGYGPSSGSPHDRGASGSQQQGDLDGSGVSDEDENDDQPLTSQQQLDDALSRLPRNLPPTTPRALTPEELEKQEKETVEKFVQGGCGCHKNKGTDCSKHYTIEYLLAMRCSCFELTKHDLDMVLLGQLMASMNMSEQVVTESRHPGTPRKRVRIAYHHQGHPVCARMYRFLNVVGESRLDNLISNLKDNGLVPRVHGNTHRLPKNTLSHEDIKNILQFLLNYSEANGVLLPGRVPGYSSSDIKLLPSSTSKRCIWKLYIEAMGKEESRAAAYRTFCRLWQQLLPYLVLMKPMTDLCWVCQKNSTAVLRAVNDPESIKSSTLKAFEDHLTLVQLERSYYRTTLDQCKESIREHFTTAAVEFQPPPLFSTPPANSVPIKAHYSFDYAQQVHFPSNPLQPGPIYFLTPRKCAVFGIACEAIPRQINFLCDEAGDCGKGANTVISQLHYFFEHHSLGEKEVYLHADNCTGQNKNNAMIQYLAWRVLTKRHTKITLSFLVVGHTKFTPDWCFGLFKRLYRRTSIGSLKDMSQVVERSAVCNEVQLVVGDDGEVIVPTYDWTDFFATSFKKLPSLKKYHHLRMTSSMPGKVYVKERSDGQENEHTLLKPGVIFDENELPSEIHPAGLSLQRQWYLYDKIREFCPEQDRDVTCPLPSHPRPFSRQNTPQREISPTPTPPSSPLSPAPPPPKRQRVCGICRTVGHDKRNCPSN
ncbi:uncharacterized protein LOC135338462 isoform X2 [Halichondria panicea]|uniref:uncharacterized protein LOC135338462 isoform X2 n=1 Tax=Halichondria panicea TaxID=6063 RepID=UPI00312B3E56